MPTNRKWLEHTERAAWDTVQSLRQEIEKERERMARLAPAGENWRKMLDELDAAKTENDIQVERYTEILSELRAGLRQARSERDALAAELASQRQVAQAPARVEVAHRMPMAREAIDDVQAGSTTTWFTDRIVALRAEQERQSGTGRPNYERCLTALELKLEELEDAPRREAPALAVEIGTLALRIAEAARPAAEPDTDD